MHHFSHMAKKLWKWSLRINLLPCTYLHSDSVATHMIHSNVHSTMRMLVAGSLRMSCRLGDGTSTARGARFPVPNRSYPAEREPARSSPIHPIARLCGSERLRRSTAKNLLAVLYVFLTWHKFNIMKYRALLDCVLKLVLRIFVTYMPTR